MPAPCSPSRSSSSSGHGTTCPGSTGSAVVLISVVGTLITDNLTDNLGVSLVTTTVVFSVAWRVVFAAWYASERTLSIHTIYTTRREAFYWLAILFTFALGTAAGDLAAERLDLGYWSRRCMFAGVIAAVAVAHYRFNLNAVARLLDRLHPDATARRLDRRLPLAAARRRRARPRHHGHERALPRRDPGRRELPEHHPEGRRRSGRFGLGFRGDVLVVAHKTAATPALLEAIRQRAERGSARFHLLVPNPAEHAELTEAERRQKHLEGEHVLVLALPLIDEVAGTHTEGSVSFRHDPMDAIEGTLREGDFHEVILSTLPRSVSRWLHVDLPHRVSHLGLPVTTVIAEERAA